MADHHTPRTLIDRLPPVPPRTYNRAGWLSVLDRILPDRPDARPVPQTPWQPVDSWGRRGWELGSWPEVIIAHYDAPDVYGLAAYNEGDITVTAYTTRTERDAATDQLALTYWHSFDNGPPDLPETVNALPPEYRGPFPGQRWGNPTK